MLRVGIFLGGKSREREVSFAGGRTVYDNLDRALFEPVPIFVDSLNRLILLDWQFLYKGTIRDFWPTAAAKAGLTTTDFDNGYVESLPDHVQGNYEVLANDIGRPITLEELPNLIDIAFLVLHGPFGEDGSLQGALDWLGVPYSGSGVFSSAFGISKALQKRLLGNEFTTGGFDITYQEAVDNQALLAARIENEVGYPCVIKAATQGSSIGVVVINHADELSSAIQQASFRKTLQRNDWNALTEEGKLDFLHREADLRYGLGYPLQIGEEVTVQTPLQALAAIESQLQTSESVLLSAAQTESTLVIEPFIEGREFSCIILEDENGKPVALPPTEIVKGQEVFSYRAKYLPGLARKKTPMDAPIETLRAIAEKAERLYQRAGFQVYARLDGFLTSSGDILFNDPNTTSGMMPSSFVFHQAAEVGLSPSALLTYIIQASLRHRGKPALRAQLEDSIRAKAYDSQSLIKTRVGVIMGGYSSERHISMESGRNIAEKLASSTTYEPIPIFLTGDADHWTLARLPLPLLLKDNADDIAAAIHDYKVHPFASEVIANLGAIAGKPEAVEVIDLEHLPAIADFVFIALHGRPGEDGALQAKLDTLGLPYNGSGVTSSQLTIDKFATNERFAQAGLATAAHEVVHKAGYEVHSTAQALCERFGLPLIAKPIDDGCSSAVKKIRSAEELDAFAQAIFRQTEDIPAELLDILKLKPKEEFPVKEAFLVEAYIGPEPKSKLIEVTVGVLTHRSESGELDYQVLEPSEALAQQEVLSLEEKFLAGEGMNITPARFAPDSQAQTSIASTVKEAIEQAARLAGVEGYARIDAFVRLYEDASLQPEVYIIEVNSLPGMTPATCIFHQAALADMRPFDFIDRIIHEGFARKALKNNTLQAEEAQIHG